MQPDTITPRVRQPRHIGPGQQRAMARQKAMQIAGAQRLKNVGEDVLGRQPIRCAARKLANQQNRPGLAKPHRSGLNRATRRYHGSTFYRHEEPKRCAAVLQAILDMAFGGGDHFAVSHAHDHLLALG